MANHLIAPAKLCYLCREVAFEDRKYQIDTDSHRIPQGDGKIFHIDTIRKDCLPELPGLRTSAENGCDFCAFLRAALLKRQLSHVRKEIQMRMSFTWGTDMDYILMYGLAALTVTLTSEDGTVDHQIVFDIGSYDGELSSFLCCIIA